MSALDFAVLVTKDFVLGLFFIVFGWVQGFVLVMIIWSRVGGSVGVKVELLWLVLVLPVTVSFW